MSKKILYFAFISLFISSCVSSTKKLAQGNYDEAIDKSIKVLMKSPNEGKEIDILNRAYTLANSSDQDAINRLKLSGQPDIWDDVLSRLNSLNYRQERVERLPSSVLTKIGQSHIDYTREIASSKLKAAEYFYAHGVELMKSNNRLNARQAYSDFVRAKSYYPSYKEVDQKITEALSLGTNAVLFRFQNVSRVIVPQDFEDDLLKISLQSLNKQWVNYYTREEKGAFYDYIIYLNLKSINVSPEQVHDVIYDDEKKVEDGYQYVLDDKGNVKKDSLGNDIKVKKFKTIKCHVKETQLEKKAMVSGTVDIYDNRNNQLVRTQNITTESFFEHRFAQVSGDLLAMSENTRKLTKIKPIPFPTDLQMIGKTAEDLKRIAKDYISKNSDLLAN